MTRALALDEAGTVWLGGTDDAGGWLAELRSDGSYHIQPAPVRVTHLALDTTGRVWVAGSDDSGESVHSFAPSTGQWTARPLPNESGSVVALGARTDRIWVRTSQKLLASGALFGAVSRPLTWIPAGDSAWPVTGAVPFVYRRTDQPTTREVPDGLIGPDCPHFVLLDEGEAPDSPLFEEGILALLRSEHSTVALMTQQGIRDLRGELEVSALQRSEFIYPVVSFELGRFYFGFRSSDLLTRYLLKSFLKEKFGPQVRELCANPINSKSLVPDVPLPPAPGKKHHDFAF